MTVNFIVRPGRPDDAEAVLRLLGRVIADLSGRGIDQWDESYPTSDHLERDLRCGSLVAVARDGSVSGFIARDTDQDPAYVVGRWAGRRPAVLHRLMVDPRVQRRGIGRTLVLAAEDQALRRGHDSVRLDVFVANRSAGHLYQRLGYRPRGVAMFRKGEFTLLEKCLGLSRARVPTPRPHPAS